MTAVNFNMRIDQDLKDRAGLVLENYGLTTTQAIKLFLKQVAETRTVPLSFDYAKDIKQPNEVTRKALLEAKNRTDFSEAYATPEAFMKAMQKLASA